MRTLIVIGLLSPLLCIGQNYTLRNDSAQVSNLTLTINTDCWPEENTWVLNDESGNEIHFGGPYQGIILDEIVVPMWLESGNYTFTFYDAAGDGLFGTQWGNLCAANGSILLQDAGGNVYLDYDGTFDFDSLTVNFAFDEAVSVHEMGENPVLKVYPNPATDIVFLELKLNHSDPLIRVEIFGTDGKMWLREDVVSGSNQTSLTPIDISHLPVGMYLITIRNQSIATTQKLIRH